MITKACSLNVTLVSGHISLCVCECVAFFLHMSKIYFGHPLPICKALWETQSVCLG